MLRRMDQIVDARKALRVVGSHGRSVVIRVGWVDVDVIHLHLLIGLAGRRLLLDGNGNGLRSCVDRGCLLLGWRLILGL